MERWTQTLAGCVLLAAIGACDSKDEAPAPTTEELAAAPTAEEEAEEAAGAADALKAGKGVDLATKTIKIGALNDESGPAATIGKPYAIGKRMAVAQVNAGGSGLLPEGWKVELIEKDHGYNPQKSVQAYNQIKDEVLFIATSFGTPNTLPLRPMLERDEMIALPASLSSEMNKHRSTIPGGTSYDVEAMRALDWVVESVGGDKSKIKAGIVYQQDDYGLDGKNGFSKAATHHGIEIISEQTVKPGQRDYAAVVTSLKKAGATHVLLTVLPSATGPILGTAAQLQYKPTWVGSSPTWIDAFFNPEVIPSTVFETYKWVTGLTYWGEDVPGMKDFLEVYEKHGKDQGEPDMYILLSYSQALYGFEMIKRAIEAGDVTREGLTKAVTTIEGFDANGLIQPISTNSFPYVASTKTRVLAPDFEKKSWSEVAPFASPAALGGETAEATPTEAEAPEQEAAKAQLEGEETEAVAAQQ